MCRSNPGEDGVYGENLSVMKEGWTNKTFGEVSEIVCGQDYKTVLDENGSYPIYGTGGIMGYASQYRCPANSVIIGRKGSINNPLFVEEPFWNVDTAFGVVPNTSVVVPKFFYYFCRNYDFTKHDVSVTIPSLRRTDILKIEISVPPLAEQERIVAELDLLTGIIDKQTAQLKELDTLAQSLFCELYCSQAKHQTVKLIDVCSIVKGLVNPNDKPYCNYPHIGGANIESNTGRFINVKLAKDENLISGKYPFDETMILYSKIRPNLNKVALPSFKGVCSADMYPIIPDSKVINKVFLWQILSQKEFLDYAIAHSGRANIPKINREDLMEYSFEIFDLEVQESFARKIESIESQKAAINRSIAETRKLFDYTMDKYFG